MGHKDKKIKEGSGLKRLALSRCAEGVSNAFAKAFSYASLKKSPVPSLVILGWLSCFSLLPSIAQAEIQLSGTNTGGDVDVDGDGVADGTWSMVSAATGVASFPIGGVAFSYSEGTSWDLNTTFNVVMDDPDFTFQLTLFGNADINSSLYSAFSAYDITWQNGGTTATVEDPDPIQLENIAYADRQISFNQRQGNEIKADFPDFSTGCYISTNLTAGLKNKCLTWSIITPSGSTDLVLNATGGVAKEFFKFGLVSYTDISVAKSVSAATIEQGTSGFYTVTVENTAAVGESAAFGLEIPVILPAGITFTSDTATTDGANATGTYDSSTGSWSIDKLARGETMTLTVNFEVDAGVSGSAITSTIDPDAISMSHDDTSDNNGNLSTSFISIDTTAPEAPMQVVTPEADGIVSVSGTGEPDATVTVTFPDGTTGTAVVDASGNYGPIVSSAPQVSGDISASQEDVAGNTSTDLVTPYTDTTARTGTDQLMCATPIYSGSPLDVTGLSNAGGTFSFDTAGGAVVVTTVSAATANNGSVVTGSTGTVRYEDPAPSTFGSTIYNQYDFADKIPMQIKSGADYGAADSNLTNHDSLTFTAVNPTANFTWVINGIKDTKTIATISADGKSIIIQGVSGSGATSSFAQFDIETSGSLTGVQTTQVIYESYSTLNSSQFELFVPNCVLLIPTQEVTPQADGTLSISGTGEPGATVTMTFPDGTTGTAVVDASGD